MRKQKVKVPNQQLTTRENALGVLKELRQKHGDKAENLGKENEATTRLLLIDPILQALGWSTDDFNPEKPVSGDPGYIDYLISADDQPQFIVEAKKRGTTFGSPLRGKLKKVDYNLQYIRGAFSQPISQVIDQATRYSHATGVPYCVITNGAEWILIQSIAHSKQSLDNLRCVYFGNFLSEDSDFDYFWEMLSRGCVLDGSLEKHFSEVNSPFAEYCRVPRDELGEPKGTPLSFSDGYLREFYDRFLGEIIDSSRRTMLQHCFVTDPVLSQYQGDLRRVLRDTAPSYIPEAIDITHEEGEQVLPPETGDQRGRVILITGSVGCGKSTLVTKVLVEARKRKTFDSITINLIDEVEGDSDKFNLFLWNEVANEWKEACPSAFSDKTLRRVFCRELKQFREEPKGKALADAPKQLEIEEANLLERLAELPQEFLPKSWRAHPKGIVVFLDNVDRASEGYQRLVYAFAHKLSRETGATVIITMREVTYFRGRKHDFLDVRSDDKVYHLQTPHIEGILSKRLNYAEVQLELEQPLNGREPDYRLKIWRRSPDWENFRASARKYIRVLRSTLLASQTASSLIALLASVAWHDVRYFLERLRSVHSLLDSDSTNWSISEVIAALMMPMQSVGGQATIANIFLPPHERYPYYFLKSRILLMLLYGKRQSELLQGTNLKVLLNFTRRYGYQERWTRRAIQEMVRERLLECVQIPAAAEYTKDYELDDAHSFRASPLAFTTIEHVQFDPVYLSLVGNELPFHEENAYKDFIHTSSEIMNLLSDEGLDRTSINLLLEAGVGTLVVRYLQKAFDDERPLGNPSFFPPEVTATEQKLNDIINRLKASFLSPTVEETILSKRATSMSSTSCQLSLGISILSESTEAIQNHISIPQKLQDGQKKGVDHRLKIFWALAELRFRGQTMATGSEITKVINNHLTDDLHKVETTNISRALRGPTLQSQNWLTTTKISDRKKLYGLAANWKQFWKNEFDEQAPSIE